MSSTDRDSQGSRMLSHELGEDGSLDPIHGVCPEEHGNIGAREQGDSENLRGKS